MSVQNCFNRIHILPVKLKQYDFDLPGLITKNNGLFLF
jgi:hypothetical protein